MIRGYYNYIEVNATLMQCLWLCFNYFQFFTPEVNDSMSTLKYFFKSVKIFRFVPSRCEKKKLIGEQGDKISRYKTHHANFQLSASPKAYPC